MMLPINTPYLQVKTSLPYIIVFLGPYLLPLWESLGAAGWSLNEFLSNTRLGGNGTLRVKLLRLSSDPYSFELQHLSHSEEKGMWEASSL